MFSPTHSILITGGNFTHVDNRQIQIVKGGFERLQEAAAPGAFHNSGERFDPPKCHPNTRVAVLKRIMDWILRLDPETRDTFIMWLYGPAGAGKSAIAQTLAELCYTEEKLLASFFFSKNDPLRSTAESLVATIAYQLALNLPHQVREHIISSVEHDPLIFTRSLETQLVALIIQPVKRITELGVFNDPHTPRLIIIDGLDECENSRVQCKILDIIFQSFREQKLPLLFLIASRPETDITLSFNSQTATSNLARLALDDEYLPDEDVRVFLVEKFTEIRRTHRLRYYIPASWPSLDVVSTLVQKSSGQFIYASTVVKFVASAHHRPTDRLEVILGIRSASGETPFADLDALYKHIFSTIEDIDTVLTIIGLVILAPPPMFRFHYAGDTHEDLERFLFLKPGDVSLILGDLCSLIAVTDGSSPRILHASLKDFLFDASRSKHLYLNPAERHTQYALLSFQHIQSDSASARILSRLLYHSRHSIFTEQLRQNIVNFSFESMVKTMLKISLTEPELYHSSLIVDYIPDFFSFLTCLPWDDDKRFYDAQLKSLDYFLMDNLNSYYFDPFLLLLVAALSDNINYHALVPSYAAPRISRVVDNARLGLNHGLNYMSYRTLLLNFLEDPIRSGTYFLDRGKYASAALCALSSVCNHFAYKLPSGHSELDKHIRLHKPRRWRRELGRNSVVHKTRMKGTLGRRLTDFVWLTSRHYLNVAEFSGLKDRRASSVCYFALISLPNLLGRSDKSEELLKFARRAKFGLRVKEFPKEAKLAKKAIAQYLSRVSEEV